MKEIIDQIVEIDALAFENKLKNEQLLVNKKQEFENTIADYREKMLTAAKEKALKIAEETENFIREIENSHSGEIQEISASMNSKYLKAEENLIKKTFNKLFVLEG